MKRLLLSALTVFTLAAVGVAIPPAAARQTDGVCIDEDAARCGRCGDGFCNPSCGENEFTCPADCKAVLE